jgi:16S rRNA (guanine1516-N2)-methyltransferase
MAIKLIKNGEEVTPEQSLQDYAEMNNLDLVLEWHDGQYWLHSDNPKERPIGIEIDRELQRHIDFFKRSSLQKELLARAIGVKGPFRPKVLDLSAGLLGDTLLFLSFGCEVVALERHPVIAFLIQSALARASHPALKKLTFIPQDASQFLNSTWEGDVIFYDPMFEDPNQKASPRKEMRIFRNMVGEDSDGREVFEQALKKYPKRLVVKRPKHSQALSPVEAVNFTGKATRYDVYFAQNTRSFESNLLK